MWCLGSQSEGSQPIPRLKIRSVPFWKWPRRIKSIKPAKTRHAFRIWYVIAALSLPLFLILFPLFAIPSQIGLITFNYSAEFASQGIARQWSSLFLAGFTNLGKPFGLVANPQYIWVELLLAIIHRVLGLVFFYISALGWRHLCLCWKTRHYSN